MANFEALKEDPEAMRTTASAVSNLKDDFETLRSRLQKAITEELKSACEGDIATEFTNYYNENIDSNLVAERERLEGIIQYLRNTATNFEQTNAAVKSSF